MKLAFFILWRPVLGLGLLALSSLAVLPPPNYLAFELSVLVTECGHWLALLGLLLFLPGWRASWHGWLGAGLAVVACLLLLSSVLRAIPVARGLPERLAAAFGPAEPRPASAAPAPPVQTHAYARRPDGELLLDLYRPAPSAEPAPCVLVIHGGSWARGSRTDFSALNPYLAARGYVVASIDYRLAPAHRFPAALEDVLEALAFLKRGAAGFGLDPRRLVLLGRSAGGHLALLAAYSAGDPAVRGVVSFYGPADLRWGYANPAPRSVYDSCGSLDDFLGGPPERFGAAYDAASPIGFAGPASPPTLLIHGARDPLVSPRHVERLSARLSAVGRPHLALVLPWATHGCDFGFGGPGGRTSTEAVEHFLAAVTR